jgi:hypothetical protein
MTVSMDDSALIQICFILWCFLLQLPIQQVTNDVLALFAHFSSIAEVTWPNIKTQDLEYLRPCYRFTAMEIPLHAAHPFKIAHLSNARVFSF